jgi:zinc D-Ala-D-Ala carboxypeptidase
VIKELVFSQTAMKFGINNNPSPELIEHAKKYLIPGLEEIKKIFNQQIMINSGYRSSALNAIIPGSSDNSQHTKFEAVDIVVPKFGSPHAVCKKIIASGIEFDQIINEYGAWAHISFSPNPRRSILSKWKGQPYVSGIVDMSGVNLI